MAWRMYGVAASTAARRFSNKRAALRHLYHHSETQRNHIPDGAA